MDAQLNRRDFLLYGSAVIAGVTLGEFGRRQLAKADARAATWRGPGAVTYAASVCRECSAGCGLRVRLVDGVPVKIDGNPRCPIARGRLCAKGQAALEAYFDPDRLIGPAKRVGARSENRWEPISWDAAIAAVANQIKSGDAGSTLALAAEEHGPFADAWTAFWSAAGAQVAWTRAATAARMRPRLEALTGVDADPVFDIERASYVLSFNAPIVETWLSPVWSQRSYGRFRRGGTQRGHLVHVDSRRSLTARKADEWIAVPEDRQAILAYGIAAVLLRERRVDQAWLDGAGASFADFERSVVERLTPDQVAEITGVPVVTILRLARELVAATQPLVAVAGDAPAALVDAALALNGLVGAFDRPGGVFASAPARHPAADLDDATVVLAKVRDGQLKPRLVVLRDASALRALGTATDVGEALDRAELVVSFSPYLDEAAAAADLILPVHTPLESWHALTPPSAGSVEAVACAKPAVAARLDTRDLFAVLGAVAEKAAGALTAITWKGSEQLVTADLERLWEVRRGSPYLESFETEWVRELESGGWWVRGDATQDAFKAAVLDSGGWMDPFLAPGRIRQTVDARGGLTFVPPVVSPPLQAANDTLTYPLRLVAFTPATVNLVGSANQPVLYEILGQPENAPWHAWIEISPETAESAGLTTGSRVRVESADGAIDAVVVVAEHMPSDTVAAAFVPATGGGRWAGLHDADVRRLWKQPPASGICAVRLRKV